MANGLTGLEQSEASERSRRFEAGVCVPIEINSRNPRGYVESTRDFNIFRLRLERYGHHDQVQESSRVEAIGIYSGRFDSFVRRAGLYANPEYEKASEEAIGQFSIHTAQAYAGQFDVDAYAEFLQDVQESDVYWRLRAEMDRFREQIGAVFVYTVTIDEQKQPILLIDGQPRDSEEASPIGEVTDMPPEAIEEVLRGNTAKSDIIRNPIYGDYISAYAPLLDKNGKQIGILGIDTDVSVSQTIYRDVLAGSTSSFVWMGIAALVFLS